jgi:Zn-dependent peptidase ImmA (M78 family)
MMIDSRRKTQIRQASADFREVNGIPNDSIIGDITYLVKDTLGYTYVEKDLGNGFAGYSQAKSQFDYEIGFNTRHFFNEQFQRFTIAHELGHVELHKEVLKQGEMHRLEAYYSNRNVDLEREADYFAISLLTPFKDFRQRILKEMPEPELLSEVAKYYNISFNAVCRRFVELTDELVTLLVVDAKANQVLYEIKSSGWKSEFPKSNFYQSKLPEFSFAQEVISGGLDKNEYSEESHLEDWGIVQEENWELAETVIPVEYNNQMMIFLSVL